MTKFDTGFLACSPVGKRGLKTFTWITEYKGDQRMATWRKFIAERMEDYNESFDDVVSCTLTDEELDTPLECYRLGRYGQPFTLWTHNRVYFPVEHDGYVSAGSVSRNPDGKPTEHV